MATAAFKSNTKRSNSTNEKQKTIRRSLSVNAVSRRSINNNNNNEEELFLNKRDNPLYWATGGSPPGDKNDTCTSQTHSSSQVVALSGSERGRSIKRNPDVKIDNGRRRSLSRVAAASTDNGRRGRSVSRPNFESETEQESRVSITYGGRSSSTRPFSRTGKVPVTGANASDRRSSHPSRHPSFDSQVSNMEDMVSTSSLSEAEEKTIKAVYEQMKSLEGNNSRKQVASSEIYETVRSEVRRAIADIQDDLQDAIRRNTTGALVSADVTDISTKLINPGGVELVFDIRREYAKELEEAQERARKLRSDLAIEEHRKQELSRILKETLPEPKTSSSHRSRLGRKSSSERKKMSKRLTDEAMSYFDECVSISTFDSSDFSAAEDPSVNSAVTATPTTGAVTGPNRWINQQINHGDLGSSSVIGSSSNESVIDRVVTPDIERDRKFRFSFGYKPTECIELQHDLQSYIKTLDKDTGLDGILLERSKDNYSLDAYNLLEVKENLLFDKVLSRNRQESGSVHLCGGVVIPFLPLNHLY
uniref:uncharacterized protein LOC122578632 n=1 Tax=Erigeron canadensis TaxID=72917 RepID=UPI001CB8EB6C|nr:uncharacterized protein LOC122578632 [Erigeron canadensis]